MLFSSNIFIFIFLPLALAGYFLMKESYRNYFLLVISLLFYACGEPKFVAIMLLSIVLNYCGGLAIQFMDNKKRELSKKLILCATIILNLSILIIFKYLNFITRNLSLLFGEGSVAVTTIALPIGISFFTFQAMSYVVDVYRGEVEAQKNPAYLGLYISFFPQLIAGPIVRYSTIADQINNREVTFVGFSQGVKRFIQGFGKKIIISNACAVIADQAFGLTGTASLSVTFAWLGAIAYTLQILFDFSGYSDMAIGLGKMFGFQFLENFNYPYISKSVSEFWRRWHMSLGSWFRDYVYIPLGGSHVRSKARLIINLFAVWFLTGLWHGASWHFVAWGLMYFVLISFEKMTKIPDRFYNTGKHGAVSVLYQIFTLLCVVVGWVIFRSNGFINSLRYLSVMFGLSGNVLVDAYVFRFLSENAVILFAAILCSTPIFKIMKEKSLEACGKYSWVIEGVTSIWYIVTFYVSVSYLVIGSHNPFIYFNF